MPLFWEQSFTNKRIDKQCFITNRKGILLPWFKQEKKTSAKRQKHLYTSFGVQKRGHASFFFRLWSPWFLLSFSNQFLIHWQLVRLLPLLLYCYLRILHYLHLFYSQMVLMKKRLHCGNTRLGLGWILVESACWLHVGLLLLFRSLEVASEIGMERENWHFLSHLCRSTFHFVW